MNLYRKNTIYSLKDNKIENHFGIMIQELPYVNKINLRIDTNDNNYITACGKILNAILPSRPNTYSKNENLKIIWLGPDEWLIIDIHDDLFIKLRNEIGDSEASVTDISENRTIIRISGEKIFTLLAKFLFLDLQKNLPDASSCAQTLFSKTPILIVRNHNDSQIPEVDIILNRSYANYIYNLIVDGSKNLNF